MTTCDNPRGYKWKRHICRCEGCQRMAHEEHARWVKRVYFRQTLPKVPVHKARALIKRLVVNRGMTIPQIASEVGYSKFAIQCLVKPPKSRRPVKFVRGELMRSLEQLEVDTRGKGKAPGRARQDQTDAYLSRAAIQALMYQGYDQRTISVMMKKYGEGVTYGTISAILRGHYKQVRKTTEAALVELVKDVGLTEGTSTLAKSLARKRGYLSAANYDEFL